MKPVHWIGSSREDLRGFPTGARRDIGFALEAAQNNDKHASAKPLRGFGGGGVLEIVEASQGNAYRAVYTVRFPEAVYVLHAFKKKSKSGIETPKRDLDMIRSRLLYAEEDYKRWLQAGKP